MTKIVLLLEETIIAIHHRQITEHVVAPIAFLVLVSLAMCVLAGSVRLLPVAVVWNLIFAVAGFVLVYVGVRVFNAWYELVQWPILESMLSLSIGSRIVWRQRSDAGEGVVRCIC